MSSQRGNVKKSGPPKYQNKSAFRNNLHDKSKKTKALNDMDIVGCCKRCKDVLDWKIKYKKYKPLSQLRKCVRCERRNIKDAYYTICVECAEKHQVCAKCCKGLDEADEPGKGGKSSKKENLRTREKDERASPSPEPSEENKIEIPRASGETATESSPQNDFSDNDICDSAASSEDDEDNKQLNLTDDDCEQSEIKAS